MNQSSTVYQSIDEGARRRFEAARRDSQNEPIEQFLPPTDHPHFLATLEELILIDLEFAWKGWKRPLDARTPTAIRPPGVESYLRRFPRLRQPDVLRRLLRHEYLVRHRYGDRPETDEFHARFPGLMDDGKLSREFQQIARVIALEGGPSVAPGERMGRYLLCSEHARGGFGLVWRAEDEALGREVALKQLSGQLLVHAGYRQRFIAEARIAAQLQHPGIVPVYDIGDPPEGEPYYTMKLVRGETLAAAIKRFHEEKRSAGEQAVEQLQLLNAYLAVTRAVAYAHSRHVIHRDLKPDNILLGSFGETVLLDWGLAKVLQGEKETVEPVPAGSGSLPADATQAGTIMGTPAYMAPEQASGHIDQVDQRSDVYALGAILYQLLTGRAPFQGHTTEDVLRQVIRDEPVRPRQVRANVSVALEAICLRALNKDPSRRYPEAALLAQELERYLADEPVEAYREPWWETAFRWSRRHRTLVAATCVGLILTMVVAAVGLFVWQEVEQEKKQRAWDLAVKREKELQQLRNETALDRKLALDELQAGRFEQGERLLAQADARAIREPELAIEHGELKLQHDRALQLKEFYRLANEAEKLAFLEYDEEAAAASLRSLDILQVTAHPRDWPQKAHLPAADLTDRQLERLREDAYRVLLFSGAMRVKLALVRLRNLKDPRELLLRARLLLQIARAYHADSPTARVLELFCQKLLQEHPSPGPPVTHLDTAADFYFMGIAHFWAQFAARNDFIRRALDQKDTQQLGLDIQNARATAEWLLRTAAALDPQHYWSLFWLGWALEVAGEDGGAELAFNTCITLQPAYALGHAERARVLVRQKRRLIQKYLGFVAEIAGTSPGGPVMALPVLRQRWSEFQPQSAGVLLELNRRIAMDLDRAVELEPREPWIQFLVGESQAILGNQKQALQAWNRALVFERPLAVWEGQSLFEEIKGRIETAARYAYDITRRDPNNTDAWTVLATALFKLDQVKAAGAWATGLRLPGQYEPALWAAGQALRLDPARAQALAVRGLVSLERGQWDLAERDLSAALKHDETSYLASDGLASTYGRSGRRAAALTELDRVRRLAPTAWHVQAESLARGKLLLESDQAAAARAVFDRLLAEPGTARHQLEAYLGQASALLALNELDDAEDALNEAARLDPDAAEELRSKLFPPARP